MHPCRAGPFIPRKSFKLSSHNTVHSSDNKAGVRHRQANTDAPCYDAKTQLSALFPDLLCTTNATTMTATTDRTMRYALEMEVKAKTLINSKAVQNTRTSPTNPFQVFLKIDPPPLLIHSLQIPEY